MFFKVILFPIVTNLNFIYGEEPFGGSHIININGCCSSPINNLASDTQKNALLANISKLMSELEDRIEDKMGTCNSVSRTLDCQDIQKQSHRTTGIYTIYPEGTFGFPVRCDMDTENGGWTVIQRRKSDSDFYRTWTEYQIGFGNLSENFWLGNQQIHAISSQGWYELRVDLVSQAGEVAYAEYNVLLVGDIDTGYKLTVDGYSGNAGDSLGYHNGQKFSTNDKDNDFWPNNCAETCTGAWWYKDCHLSNLNGKYGAPSNKGPRWHFKDSEPMRKTEMKIRRWVPSGTDSL